MRIVALTIILISITIPKIYCQTFDGNIFNKSDSSIVSFANLIFYNEADSLVGAEGLFCDNKCKFKIPPNTTSFLVNSHQFADLVIENYTYSDNLILSDFYLIKSPDKIQVHFIGSDKEVNKAHKKLIKNYNKSIKNYRDIIIKNDNLSYTMKPSYKKQDNTKRLKLVYTINYKSIEIK
ncbi:MAG: hypothetical protein ACJA1Z_002083 [Patiriisocius sp.]|jgi:hypothetical protein